MKFRKSQKRLARRIASWENYRKVNEKTGEANNDKRTFCRKPGSNNK